MWFIFGEVIKEGTTLCSEKIFSTSHQKTLWRRVRQTRVCVSHIYVSGPSEKNRIMVKGKYIKAYFNCYCFLRMKKQGTNHHFLLIMESQPISILACAFTQSQTVTIIPLLLASYFCMNNSNQSTINILE